MVPIQVILLLILCSVAGVTSDDVWPRLSAWYGLSGFALAMMAITCVVYRRARQSIAALHDPATTNSGVASRMDYTLARARWMTLAMTALLLFGTHFPEAVIARVYRLQPLDDSPVPEILFLLPALGAWMVFWAMGYYVEKAARERALPYRLAQAMPAHPMPSLWQYLGMQCRHQFYVLLPVVLHTTLTLGAESFRPWVPEGYRDTFDVVMGTTMIIVVLLVMPWLIVHVWSTVPLAGPLRRKFDEVAATYHLRFRNILLWKTHNGVINAAILGWVPFARYFLMTDELMETLSDPQLEAVFAHEVGHGVHRHMWWYVGGFVGATLLASGIGFAWFHFLPDRVAHFAGPDTIELVVSASMIGFLAVGFPLVSRRFEHQADWFACQHMAKAARQMARRGMLTLADEPGAPLSNAPTASEQVTLDQYRAGQYPHAAAMPAEELPALPPLEGQAPGLVDWLTAPPPAETPIPKLTPAEAGAEIFISALDTIVETSHRSRDRQGFMHPSINRRVRLLRNLARNPEAADVFHRAMLRTRLWLAAFCVAGLLAGVGLYVDWRNTAKPAPTKAGNVIPGDAKDGR